MKWTQIIRQKSLIRRGYFYGKIFKLQFQNKSIVTIKAYNEMADFYYSHVDKDYVICIKGRLNKKGEVIIKTWYVLF